MISLGDIIGVLTCVIDTKKIFNQLSQWIIVLKCFAVEANDPDRPIGHWLNKSKSISLILLIKETLYVYKQKKKIQLGNAFSEVDLI